MDTRFIRSPANGPLGCVLLLLNKTGTNIQVQDFLKDTCFLFPLVNYLGMEELDHTVGTGLTF